MTFNRHASRAALTAFLLLPPISFALATDLAPSPALAQLQSINDGGAESYRAAADGGCVLPARAATASRPGDRAGSVSRPDARADYARWSGGRQEQSLHDQSFTDAAANNRTANETNITIGNGLQIGGGFDRHEERKSLPFLGAGIGGVVGIGLVIALGCALGPLGMVGLAAFCVLAGAGAQLALGR